MLLGKASALYFLIPIAAVRDDFHILEDYQPLLDGFVEKGHEHLEAVDLIDNLDNHWKVRR